MNEAARRGELFHLWFHPHNFGINLEKNIQMLSAVLVHFDKLRQRFAWPSLTMSEAAGLS